jgi:hypothetical protein
MEEFEQYSTLYPSSGFVHGGVRTLENGAKYGRKRKKKEEKGRIKWKRK